MCINCNSSKCYVGLYEGGDSKLKKPASISKDYNAAEQKEITIDVPFSLEYDKNVRELPYRRRENDFKPTVHWGQRKLLLCEIQFLTEYGHLCDTIVYAGAAAGYHINYLSSLFPTHKFELWDPNPFDVTLYKNKNIKIHQEYFTDEVAKSYSKSDVFFWSDIRTGKHDSDFEKNVEENMRMQERWHRLSNAVASMLKFRLPYQKPDAKKSQKYKYLDGKIYMQVWAPQTSTETRLIALRDCKEVEYDPKLYESRMYRFNNITRIWQFFSHVNVAAGSGIDGCYDCRAEIEILSLYCKLKKLPIDKNVPKMITEVTAALRTDVRRANNKLLMPPHAVRPNDPMIKKYDELREKYFDTVRDRNQKIIKMKSAFKHTSSV